jgi:hypothetical protein
MRRGARREGNHPPPKERGRREVRAGLQAKPQTGETSLAVRDWRPSGRNPEAPECVVGSALFEDQWRLFERQRSLRQSRSGRSVAGAFANRNSRCFPRRKPV